MTKQYDKTRRNMSKSGEKAFKKGQTNAMTAAASLIPIGQAASAIGIAAKGALQARKAARMRKLIDGAIRKNKSITPIKTKQPDVSKFLFPRMKRPEAPLQNGKELKPIMIKPNMGKMIKPMAKFPDLSGDGKVTKKDILMGKGVIDKPKMQNGKTLKELQDDITRAGKIAISTSDPNERDAALMKKRILMKERDDKIAANKKNLKTNKTNKTKPTMKKPKMYNKPKMDHGKKPKMYNKPKYYGKKKK